jgi:tRNA(fMet)-specific endonuclease VapC
VPNYIMDTDHTSYILRGDPSVIENAKNYDAAITIITVQELFNGWVSRANDPKQADRLAARLRDRLIEIYAKLSTTVGYFKTVEILDFTSDADSCLKQLLKNHATLRKNRLQKDLRIAAIALSLGATLATCNQRDFGQVPGLITIDWLQR